MLLINSSSTFRKLTAGELEAWRNVPSAVASDCMNRTQVMGSAIKPVSEGLRICGQARTVSAMVGDSSPITTLIEMAKEGEVIVVDADGVTDTAVWGGMMTEKARYHKLAGAVIDGAIRDVADIRKSGFPMFCVSAVPRGPHQGFGGTVDATISVSGVPVRPGDLVLGDDDGVVVVPLEWVTEVLRLAQEHLVNEENWIRDIRKGLPIDFKPPNGDLFNISSDT